MVLPRATTTELGRREGKNTVTKVVRAASKPGAMLTARVDAIGEIPLRAQRVGRVESLGNSRFLDKWVVEVEDRQELESIGKI